MAEKLRGQPPASPVIDVLAAPQATSRWQERVYKRLRAHPELSFQETETAALAASKLKELGYEVFGGFGRTGGVGILRGGEGRTVLARADTDALPVKESAGLTYASTLTAADLDGQTVNVAHAYGHDARARRACRARRNCSPRRGGRGAAPSCKINPVACVPLRGAQARRGCSGSFCRGCG